MMVNCHDFGMYSLSITTTLSNSIQIVITTSLDISELVITFRLKLYDLIIQFLEWQS